MTAAAIVADAGALLTELASLGFTETDSRYDPTDFGNYYVELAGAGRTFRIVRDRSRYHLEADHARLQRQGLLISFEALPELRAAVLKYVGAAP
jgi:hypothetical protein